MCRGRREEGTRIVSTGFVQRFGLSLPLFAPTSTAFKAEPLSMFCFGSPRGVKRAKRSQSATSFVVSHSVVLEQVCELFLDEMFDRYSPVLSSQHYVAVL
jgi:hypothetical protein